MQNIYSKSIGIFLNRVLETSSKSGRADDINGLLILGDKETESEGSDRAPSKLSPAFCRRCDVFVFALSR